MEKIVVREIEESISKWLESKEVVVIRGPRQSGKTTLLKRIISILKKMKIDEKRIHFVSLEDDFEKEKFEKDPKEYIEYYTGQDKKKHFFLLDEVQYVKSAGKILKLIYDSMENIKLIVTGSSTLDITDIGSYLVGRALFFELYPFSFAEFLKAKDEKLFEYYKLHKFNINSKAIPKALFLEKLNFYLKEYLIYGGYPAIVLERDAEKKKFLLKNLFLTYIEKDIVKVYGIKYKQKILDLVKYLSSVNSSILSYEDLCRTANLYFKEAKEILGILENTYVIRLVKPFHKNLISELRKNPKVYFVDSGLRNFIYGRFDLTEEEIGKILENYVLNKFREEKINYWRTTAKAEVDFVLTDRVIPIEIKLRPKITRALRSFINTYNPKIAIIANFLASDKKKVNKTNVFIIPAALL